MNRIVIITGATSGCGLAAVKTFTKNGDTVIAVSRDGAKVSALLRENGSADDFVLDVADYDGWLRLREYVEGKYGRADVLINNAGSGVCIEEISRQSRENIDKAIAVNLTGTIYGSSVFGGMMKKQRGGRIYAVYQNRADAVACTIGWRGEAPADAQTGVLPAELETAHISAGLWACFPMRGADDTVVNRFYGDVLYRCLYPVAMNASRLCLISKCFRRTWKRRIFRGKSGFR